MTRNKTLVLATAAFASALTLACDDTDTDDAEVRIWMDIAADVPVANPTPDDGDLNGILIAFDTISVHHTERGWFERSTSAGLMDLMNPRILPVMLSSWRLPLGSYDEIRFHVYRAGVIVGDMYLPLEIPSGDTSGLKIHTSFCLAGRGDLESLELAWDAVENLHYDEQRGYWLSPSITVWSAPTCTDDMTTPESGR